MIMVLTSLSSGKHSTLWLVVNWLSLNCVSCIIKTFLFLFKPSGNYGIPAPWYFPFTASFWADLCCCLKSNSKEGRGLFFTNIMQKPPPVLFNDKGKGTGQTVTQQETISSALSLRFDVQHLSLPPSYIFNSWLISYMFLHVVFSQARALFRPRLARTSQSSQWALPSMVSPRSMATEWLLKTLMFPSMRAMSPHCLVTMAPARPPPCTCATTVFSVFPRSAS